MRFDNSSLKTTTRLAQSTLLNFSVKRLLAIDCSLHPEMVKPLGEASIEARPSFNAASQAAKATR
jgi:hypothetical protein